MGEARLQQMTMHQPGSVCLLLALGKLGASEVPWNSLWFLLWRRVSSIVARHDTHTHTTARLAHRHTYHLSHATHNIKHTHTPAHAHTHAHAHAHARARAARTHARTHARTSTHTHTHVQYTRTHTYTHVHTHVHTHTHTYTHTYTQVHTYTYIWFPPPQYPGVVASCIKTIDIYSVF